jgi:hypothetical protein
MRNISSLKSVLISIKSISIIELSQLFPPVM